MGHHLNKMPNFDETTTDELLDELEKRFDHCVFHGRRLLNAEENTYIYRKAHKGGIEQCIFLLRNHEWFLHYDYEQTARGPESWEQL